MKKISQLRPWQEIAYKNWENNELRGCIEVATGGGKTLFALYAYSQIITRNSNLKVLVIVPTSALADQWYLNFQEDLGINESDIKIINSKELEIEAKINIAIINTARKFNHKISNSKDIFLIVDECHRAGSEENSKSLIKNCFATLGLSATPFREFDDGFKKFIKPFLGDIIFTYSIEDAIRDGVLSNMTIYNVKIPLLPTEKREFDDLSSKIAVSFARNSDKSIVDALLRKRARLYNNAFYRIPSSLSILESRKGSRTLVFFESISAAKQCQQLFQSHGHSVTIYHSELPQNIRRANLRLFRRGVFDVLIACRALDEGFNVPEARVALISAGTSSKRQRIQRMGRVLRSMAGKDSAEIITIYATDVEETRLIEEASRFKDIVPIKWQVIEHG